MIGEMGQDIIFSESYKELVVNGTDIDKAIK
jgi:hypothetical protein